MAFKIKDLQKNAASPDVQLLSRAERMWFFAEQHRAALIGAFCLIVLLGIGIGVLVWLEETKEEEAWKLQHTAAQLYIDRPLDQPETAQKNLDRAIAIYREILEKYPNTASAELAGYFIGNALMDQENYQGALEAYQQHIQQYGKNKILLGLVYQRMGFAYLFLDNPGKAKEFFSKALEIPGGLNKDQVLFELAKLTEETETKEAALPFYKQILNTYPNSPFASEASVRVKALEPESEAIPETKESTSSPPAETESTQETTPSTSDSP